MAEFLIVTPLPYEMHFVVQSFVQRGYGVDETTFGKLRGARIPEFGICIAPGGHGKAQFALQTQYLLDRCEAVEMVACVGAAGALTTDIEVGDVVVSIGTVEHDYTQRFTERPIPHHNVHGPSVNELRMINERMSFEFSVHYGLIASGDEDIISVERARELRAETNGLCVAWEGSGGARACAFNDVPFLEIRGITDDADHHAAQHFRENLEKAMHNIVALLEGWRIAP